MRISPAEIIIGLFLSVPSFASAAPCSLSLLTIEASKDGKVPVRIVADLTKGEVNFFEGYPYSYTSSTTIYSDGRGIPVDQKTSTTTVDVGFKGAASCYGQKVLIDFNHTELIGVQPMPMALTDVPSYPPSLDRLRTTLVIDGGADSVPESRTMNGWLYIFRAE